jgi:hypothetical protein
MVTLFSAFMSSSRVKTRRKVACEAERSTAGCLAGAAALIAACFLATGVFAADFLAPGFLAANFLAAGFLADADARGFVRVGLDVVRVSVSFQAKPGCKPDADRR